MIVARHSWRIFHGKHLAELLHPSRPPGALCYLQDQAAAPATLAMVLSFPGSAPLQQ
jgi:hypothetical protein